MRKPSSYTHGLCRSLLQKAVRRGDVERVNQVLTHLIEIDDGDWVRRRAYVIVFEECWPLAAGGGSTRPELIRRVLDVTASEKNKDAAGLSALSFALSQGDRAVLDGGPGDRALKIIANGITRPDDFWKWIRTQVSGSDAEAVVQTASRAYRQGAFEWDRALYIAASYLAVTEGVPQAESAPKPLECPSWVACDRHTREGKVLLGEIAAAERISPEMLEWIAFYCEGARTNALRPGAWWPRETAWRLGKVGIDVDRAAAIWRQVRDASNLKLKAVADRLDQHLIAAQPQLTLGM